MFLRCVIIYYTVFTVSSLFAQVYHSSSYTAILGGYHYTARCIHCNQARSAFGRKNSSKLIQQYTVRKRATYAGAERFFDYAHQWCDGVRATIGRFFHQLTRSWSDVRESLRTYQWTKKIIARVLATHMTKPIKWFCIASSRQIWTQLARSCWERAELRADLPLSGNKPGTHYAALS